MDGWEAAAIVSPSVTSLRARATHTREVSCVRNAQRGGNADGTPVRKPPHECPLPTSLSPCRRYPRACGRPLQRKDLAIHPGSHATWGAAPGRGCSGRVGRADTSASDNWGAVCAARVAVAFPSALWMPHGVEMPRRAPCAPWKGPACDPKKPSNQVELDAFPRAAHSFSNTWQGERPLAPHSRFGGLQDF